ncbi:MAG TPA: efflux RND transporter periplasmic adaptor subunit [Flavihumibacter sp.]
MKGSGFSQLILIVCAAPILLVAGCNSKQLEEKAIAFSMSETMMNQCEFARATLKDVKNEIRLFGKIEADNNRTAQVFSVVGGLVTSIKAGLGDYVKEGDVLATIQSTEVATFQKERMNALNDVAIAEKALKVAKELYEGKLNTEKDVVAAEIELEKARAELARIQQVYGIYDIKPGSVFPVRAPISGFVIKKNINRNELLRPDENEPLFAIANTSEIWAVAYVNESDISQIKENYDVEVNTLAFPDKHYQGKIEKIYNVIDPTTKSMKFRVRIANDDYHLKPDMNCTVSVHYSEDKQMVAVPSSALIFDKSKYWVMVFHDRNNIETRRVEVYRKLGDITYIQSGLNEDETVITKNSLLIYDALND